MVCNLCVYVYIVWRHVCLAGRHLIVGYDIDELSLGVPQPDADQRHQAVVLLN